MRKMKLSVIVPVYNVEKYIRRCLESIIAQTYDNLEIILVDDGSTDRSGVICDEYAAIDSRIQVIHKQNGGLVSARQAGIMRAIGEYTMHIDSDDWIEQNAYEDIVEILQEYNPDMFACGYKKEYMGFIEEYHQGIESGFYFKKDFWKQFNECVNKTFFFNQPIDMSLCNKAIKTELLKKYQMSCTNFIKKNTDDAVVFPCLLDINSIYVSTRCFYHYCVRKTSLLWHSNEKDYDRYLQLAQRLISVYLKSKNKESMNPDFLMYKLFYHLILDVPEKLISRNKCMIYPRVKPGSNIIVYGKGVFANRFIKCIEELEYCNIVANIDKTNVESIKSLSEGEYEYIVIAIFNSVIVETTIDCLMKLGISYEKIICIEKENLTFDILPDEVKTIMEYNVV